MSEDLRIWWVFVLGTLATGILMAGVVVTLVISHKRYLAMHRNQARQVLEAQEAERARVAREVHDDAVQRLGLIGKECSRASQALAARAPEEASLLSGLRAEVDDLGVFLRGLAHQLHPSLLERGLHLALTGLADEMERGFGLHVALELPDAGTALGLSAERELVAYRIAQEALHNIVKHAQVNEARLRLVEAQDGLELAVSDAGCGFDPLAAKGEGMGLVGIRERAYLAGGEVAIASRRGGGTEVRVKFSKEEG